MSIYRTIVTPTQVEDAVEGTLKKWLGSYIAEASRQLDRDPLEVARPRSWNVTGDSDNWAEDQLPAVIIVAQGVNEVPVRNESGDFSAWWDILVVSIVSTPTERDSRALAGIYAAAIRACMLQHQSLEDEAEGVRWIGEDYAAAPVTERNRTLASAAVEFKVRFGDVTTYPAGPAQPDPEGYPDTEEDWDYPEYTADTVEVEVEGVPLTEVP